MRVAIIGAGVTGLVAAHRLASVGHECDVYERWPGLGGQAATVDVGDGLRLERYYHHLFMSDRHIADLYRELGLADEIEWRKSSVAIYLQGQTHPFTTPLDILRFRPLTLRSRIRMGLAVLLLQYRHPEVEPFEGITASEWIRENMGNEVHEKVWGPLLRAKFNNRADEISMAWLWSKLTMRRQIKGRQARTEMLGYPRSSFEPLFLRLKESIETAGGRVLIDCPAARIQADTRGFHIRAGQPGSFRRGHDPRTFQARTQWAEHYDAVIATIPNEVFVDLVDRNLLEAIVPTYVERLRSIEYHTAICLLLQLDRRLTRSYWTNIADPEIPFIGVIEHTNFVDSGRYRGRHFAYIANYRPRGDPLADLDMDELIGVYEPGIREMNPTFERSWIRQSWLFREPAAQPIVTLNYQDRLPPLETGVPGLLLANTTQVYPEDRGTNYAVRLGTHVAQALLHQERRASHAITVPEET